MFKYIKFEKVKNEFTTLEFRGDAEGVEVFHFDVSVVSIKGDVEDDIDALIAQQPSEINCTEITQDEFKVLVSNSAQVNRIREVVTETYNKSMSSLLSKYPIVERETWQIQLNEAIKYKDSSDEDDAPFLKTLADEDGTSLDDFADAVIAKANAFRAFSASELAKKRTHQKEMFAKIGL